MNLNVPLMVRARFLEGCLYRAVLRNGSMWEITDEVGLGLRTLSGIECGATTARIFFREELPKIACQAGFGQRTLD